MTMEEALAVIQKIADAWNAFGQAIENAAQAIQDMFRGLTDSDELWPKRNGIPPKNTACPFIDGFVRPLLATNLSRWLLEISLTSGGPFKKQA